MPTKACLAVLNAGSSSIKFALYDPARLEAVLYRGQIDGIGVAPKLHVTDGAGKVVSERSWDKAGFGHAEATHALMAEAQTLLRGVPVVAAGHRVVHGGTEFAEPVRVTADVIARLSRLIPLAPLHEPHNIAPMQTILEVAGHVPQVACFDTAFHRRQPELAQMFGLPREMTEHGIRRYGFHGLSYEYITCRLREQAPDLAAGKVVIAHLGNGASLCAVRAGSSIASTMGFSAVDGLMMGTRSGALDPGVLIYLMDERGMDARALEDLLYRNSGLLGVSGISSDMRALRASKEPAAAEAIALFVYRIVREIGSLAAALGGLDGLVFTAGIGEHDAATRAEVVAGCAWLGLRLDTARNGKGEGRISADHSAAPVWVIPTDEERMIAHHTAELLGLSAA
ncbi:MAG TPA: acetate/propionate family kinase [Acetobacteraceae bacterium]|nr:acetate/propionate family kinase [Acetobacteraceae bacterium]